MSELKTRYSRTTFPVLVYCGTARTTTAIIRYASAWEEFNDVTVSTYLSEGVQTFSETLKYFTNPNIPYDSVKAKELRFMLEALIEVKEVFVHEDLPVVQQEG